MLVSADNMGTAISVPVAPKEMLSVIKANDLTHVRINFSSLSMMQECWRKTELALIRNLRSTLESPATLFGSAFHRGLETYYSAPRDVRGLPPQYKVIMDMIGSGIWQDEWEEFVVFRAARDFVTKAEPLKGLAPENKRSIATGIWILRHYFDVYKDDPYLIYSDKYGPMVERKFTMRIHEEPGLIIDAFGQIDVVLRNEVTGLILPGDHKTTSQLGAQFYQRLNPNHQYTFYSWAARDVFGLETESFLVNAAQVKEMPKTARGSGPQFARQVTTRTQEDFTELKQVIIWNVKQYLRYEDAGYFPMSAPGPCSNYGGCQYHDICAAPAQLRENIITAKYKGVSSGQAQ